MHQSGGRRLREELERIRDGLSTEGALPLFGARVRITPDGVCHLYWGGRAVKLGVPATQP
ncbi:hypothetical protein [Streptomyces uncialis]|uniref:hypothetical protein n=1 Tax=Streptomyces uncialis TaxID=1048205 RepID=UPI0033FF0E58